MAQSSFPKPIFVGAATRTPIGKFGGALKRFTAAQLATLCLKEAIRRAPEAGRPDFVALGHARQAGAGPNPARQATIFSGLGEDIPAATVNQACASGLMAVILGAEKIALGRARSVWTGGVESMSNTPYLLMKARWGERLGHDVVVDGMHQDGFLCPMSEMVMGATVENFVAKERGISRADQDEYALRSQRLADEAWKSGKFKNETFEILGEGKLPGLADDEHRRGDTNLESLAKLAPVFDAKGGSITAGNSSGITDGAAWMHVSDQKSAHAQIELLDYENVAIDPKHMGVAPIPAIQNLLKRQGLTIDDLESIEINEAFAAMILAAQRELKIPIEKLNPRGGSIAIGHPIGASGARILTTLTHSLTGKPGALGLTALCVSGGMGVAMLVRRL